VRVEEDKAYVRLVSDQDTAELSGRDARLVTLLVAGVTRWQRYLDFVVSHHYTGNMDKLEPAVLQVLTSPLHWLHPHASTTRLSAERPPPRQPCGPDTQQGGLHRLRRHTYANEHCSC
jgi:hypothetical protein